MPASSPPLSLVATCALGLEQILDQELSELGVHGAKVGKGAVTFRGSWQDVLRCNWRLRTANRVLVELASWPAEDGDALAAGAQRLLRRGNPVSWGGISAAALFHPDQTLAVRATARASQIRDVRWVALKVKDGLVDGQRERFRRRSSIERQDPDLPLRLSLVQDHATLLLDTSGEPLDRRGYRRQTVAAPVREQLAAAMVLASGWDGNGPVVDPMCGSGTLLAEAAWWALGWAPGYLRRDWAFQRLPGYSAETLARVRQEELPSLGPEVRCYGMDRNTQALVAARANLKAARLGGRCQLRRGDAYSQAPPDGPGLVLINPAYGERLEEQPEQWKRLGDLLKQRYTGWRAVILAGDAGRGKWIGLRPSRRLPVKNGPLDARILCFELY